ncbi:MAG: altronate dehydratase [Clostridia bacterium]|nr:altronate dehydratase [Clostridia bacterium]
MNNAIIIDEKDNVAVALTNFKKGNDFNGITLQSDIPQKHKFALCNIKKGEKAIKYGFPIGIATEDIRAGEHVHTHNLKTAITETEAYEFCGGCNYTPTDSDVYFNGFLRDDGKVGIRNRILIIPTVGCANNTAKEIAQKAKNLLGLEDNTICALTHPYGCSQLGEDAENTGRCLARLCKHPNTGGALLVSLGCENNNLEVMSQYLGEYDTQRIRTLNMQESDDEILDGVSAVECIYNIIKKDIRTKQPLSKLTVGFKCGGSDGLSGITANPLCGKICDRLTSEGAKVILTEVPEMFGAEKLLMQRAESKEVFDACVKMINGFKKYFTDHGQVVYENPSPGNKKGGITTLEEKSLGCITKGGFSTVTDILDLYEPCKKSGLSLLRGPGNDIVSTTNLTCSDATIILFTTGRGTPLGAPVPTIKISTNSELAKKKKNWIDFDAGILLEGTDFSQTADNLLTYIISVANGEKTFNEKHDYEEIAIFKDGITL